MRTKVRARKKEKKREGKKEWKRVSVRVCGGEIERERERIEQKYK